MEWKLQKQREDLNLKAAVLGKHVRIKGNKKAGKRLSKSGHR